MPKVSVIIPVYNVKAYLAQCLDSVLGQTMTDIEVICVDDQSSDGSFEMLLRYAENDSRLKVVRQENAGAGAARNHGMQYATGEYLSFLDADDFFEPNMLDAAYRAAKQNDSDIVVFGCDHYNNSENTYTPNHYSIHYNLLPEHQPFAGTDVPKDIFKLFVGWAWDKLFKKSFVQKNGLLFQEQRTTNDMLFVFSAVVKAEKIMVLGDILAHHRREAGSLSVTREKSWHCFYDALIALRKQLQDWGMYQRFEQDFINYCVHFSLWNLNTLKEPTHTILHNKLREEWFEDLGVLGHPAEFFYNSYEYSQYRKVYEHQLLQESESSKSESSNINLNDISLTGKEKEEKLWKDGTVNDMNGKPKISVIMPSLNVRPYIEECIESALNQTLKDIEIICVDAGSTDGTLEVLREYEQRDNRIKVIISDVKSYGHQMNLGFDQAKGEYFAILETDDYIKPTMYETLYAEAEKHNVDLIKADYEIFTGDQNNRKFSYGAICRERSDYYHVIDPAERTDIFNAKLYTWAGIYKMSFLRENNIRHNETPGASYQDNGFWFQTFAWAKRIYFIDRSFYMLRRDNPNSSVFNRGKVYTIFEEYRFIENRLRADKEKEEQFIKIFQKKKFDNCRFHYERVADEYKLDFLRRMADEFKKARADGELDPDVFIGSGYKTLCEIMDDTEAYNTNFIAAKKQKASRTPEQEIKLLKSQLKATKKELEDLRNSLSFRIGRAITFIPRKIRGGIRCCRDHGFLYTVKRAFTKLLPKR